MSKPKKLSAMDLLVRSDALKPALSQNNPLSRNPLANLHDGTPIEISPNSCRPWKLADRPENETLHKEDLMQSFRQNGIGQIQPIVVRSIKDPDIADVQYEVICGRVRWLAAKELGISVQAIVRELDDRQAYLVMSAENRQRKSLSDYAKAKSYQQVLAFGVFDSAQALAEAEGISKSKLSQYLGFAELPEAVAACFADITKLPYRTGYELNKACRSLGAETIAALVPKIEAGEISRDELQAMSMAEAKETADQESNLTENATENTETTIPQAGSATVPEMALKKRVLSSSGHKLFTYNPATRGWLIRIAPEVSARMNETLMLEIGKLLEAHLNGSSD